VFQESKKARKQENVFKKDRGGCLRCQHRDSRKQENVFKKDRGLPCLSEAEGLLSAALCRMNLTVDGAAEGVFGAQKGLIPALASATAASLVTEH
jgi:hypothetical protein